MVLQLLHQADLCLLLNGLMGRTVLAYAEGVVCPDELHRQLHEGSHADGGLHVVGEYEEGAAGGDDAAVEGHADAAAGHRQLSHAGLEEGAAEVAGLEGVGLLQEAVGLIGVAEVGRGADHVGNLLGEDAEDGSAGVARGVAALLLHLAPVHLRGLAAEPFGLCGSALGIGLCPGSLFGFALGHNLLQLFGATGIELLDIVEDNERILSVSAKVGYSFLVSVAAEGSTVGLAVALVAGPCP